MFPFFYFYLMNTLENFFLDLGLGWTFAKIAYYVLFSLLGFFLFLVLSKIIKVFQKIKLVLIPLFVIIGFFIGFAINPIYVGDFSNNHKIIQDKQPEFEKNQLTLISIPGCPYCYGSIGKLKKIQQRQPKLNIKFVVCSSDTSQLDWYKTEVKDAFPVVLAKNIEQMAAIANHAFPCFVYVNSKGEIKKWKNDDFGVRAVDEVEAM